MNVLKLLFLIAASHGFNQVVFAQPESNEVTQSPVGADTQAPPSNAKPTPNEIPDGPPKEPPYVNTDKEFDSPSSSTSPPPSVSNEEPTLSSSDKNPKSANEKEEQPRWIEHPLSKKGLKIIEADGSYIYKIKENIYKHSGSFRVGFLDPPNISSVDGLTDFSKMYGDKKLLFLIYDMEWYPFEQFGKLGLKGGLGFFTAQGQGRFIYPDPQGKEPKEKYTFLALPIYLGAVYRLEYISDQWFAPYLSGGGAYYLLAELRDDSKTKRYLGSAGVYGGGGLLFNMSFFDKDLAFRLQNEYDVGTLWMNLEYRYIVSASKELDMSGSLFTFGFTMDY